MRITRGSLAVWLIALAVPLACGGLTTEPVDSKVEPVSQASASSGASNAFASTATGSSGSAATSSATTPAGELPAATEQALMDRWNAAVDAAGTTIDFHWLEYDQFPHPTFKGGSEDAYGEFATVLLQFFQQSDDFDFLANGHLFTTPLLYVFPSGQIGIDTTFQQLAAQLSSSTGFGDTPAATRQALAAFLARMQ
jgi:hypothetical protein